MGFVLICFYLIPLVILWGLAFVSIFSKRVSWELDIDSWGRFFSVLLVGIAPVVNVVHLGEVLSGILPTPKAWRD